MKMTRLLRTTFLIFLTLVICSFVHHRKFIKSQNSLGRWGVLSIFELLNNYYAIIYRNISVVLSADDDSNYLFPLPITVLFWRRLGIPAIICFSNSSTNFVEESSQLVLDSLKSLQAQLIFLNTSLAPRHTIAQTCRLYVSSSPLLKLDDSHILITSDADLWSFKLENHIPIGKQKIFLYNSECCGFTNLPNNPMMQFEMRPMATIAMSVHLWRTLMHVEKDWLVDGDVLSRRLYEEYSEDLIKNGVGKPSLSESWYADQIIISYKLYLYANQSDYREEWIGKHETPPFRIDRVGWPSSTELMNVYASYVDDAHILHPLHHSYNWMRTQPLLEIYLKKRFTKLLTKYRNMFDHLINSRNYLF